MRFIVSNQYIVVAVAAFFSLCTVCTQALAETDYDRFLYRKSECDKSVEGILSGRERSSGAICPHDKGRNHNYWSYGSNAIKKETHSFYSRWDYYQAIHHRTLESNKSPDALDFFATELKICYARASGAFSIRLAVDQRKVSQAKAGQRFAYASNAFLNHFIGTMRQISDYMKKRHRKPERFELKSSYLTEKIKNNVREDSIESVEQILLSEADFLRPCKVMIDEFFENREVKIVRFWRNYKP